MPRADPVTIAAFPSSTPTNSSPSEAGNAGGDYSVGWGGVSSHVTVDRLQFTLTVTFHYLFPILTMGLALMMAWLKSVSYLGRENPRFPLLRKTEEERAHYEAAAVFWAKIFAVNFAVGVVTGIPLEFQFGTNWAAFSNYAGGVIGHTPPR